MNNTNTTEQANDAKVHKHIALIIDNVISDIREKTTVIVADESDVVEELMALITNNDKSDIINNKYDGKYINFDDILSSDEMDIYLIYYDWLADLGATTVVFILLFSDAEALP